MAIDLFGYNGVFELDQSVVNELLATYLYEQYLIPVNGQVTDGDFIKVVAPIKNGGEIHLYLELARPFLHIQTSDGTNLVTLRIPFSKIGVFLQATDGTLTRRPVEQLIELVLFDVPVLKTDLGLSVDFSQLSGDKVGLGPAVVTSGPTGVGGVEDRETEPPLLANDATIENLLTDENGQSLVVAKDLRQQIADRLKQGALGPTTVPVSPGGTEAALQSWDLMLFGNANDRNIADQPGDAGADILLFQEGNTGLGVRTDAGQTLPPSAENPQYSWALSLRASVLLDDINEVLDQSVYYVQSSTVKNTPDNPLGYLVVPAAGSNAFALPKAGKITVQAPQAMQAQVTIAGGSLTPNGRARLRNLDLNVEVGFAADGNGAATLSIRADKDQRLALTIDAISLDAKPSLLIWRPTISFQNGAITASFHYYFYTGSPCDLEGDASVRLALYADRTQRFSIGVQVIDADASAPWWIYVTAWLGPKWFSHEVLAPFLVALVPTIAHSLANTLIGGNIDALKRLISKIRAPSFENLALVLDQVDVYETGLELSGRADAGSILASDRTVAYSTQPGVVLLNPTAPPPIYMRFDWKPAIATIDVTSAGGCAVMTTNAREAFWSASYDDLLRDGPFTRDPFPLSPGDSVMVWVAVDGGHSKVLFERPPGVGAPTEILITWIAFRDRVGRSVKLVNGIQATAVGGFESLTLEQTLYKYDGTISLVTQKFFLSDDTRGLGQEQWFWDDQPVPDAGLAQPGGTVTLDAINRQLIVHLDQSALVGNQDIPAVHWVKFHGTDVFGLTLETKILVQTFPIVTRPRAIAGNVPLGPAFINPLGDPIRERPAFDRNQLSSTLTDLLTPQVGLAQAQSLAWSLSEALATGASTLDRGGAASLLTLLGDRFSGIHSG